MNSSGDWSFMQARTREDQLILSKNHFLIPCFPSFTQNPFRTRKSSLLVTWEELGQVTPVIPIKVPSLIYVYINKRNNKNLRLDSQYIPARLLKRKRNGFDLLVKDLNSSRKGKENNLYGKLIVSQNAHALHCAAHLYSNKIFPIFLWNKFKKKSFYCCWFSLGEMQY